MTTYYGQIIQIVRFESARLCSRISGLAYLYFEHWLEAQILIRITTNHNIKHRWIIACKKNKIKDNVLRPTNLNLYPCDTKMKYPLITKSLQGDKRDPTTPPPHSYCSLLHTFLSCSIHKKNTQASTTSLTHMRSLYRCYNII